MKYAAILPYAWPPYIAACRATMAQELQVNTLFIDDTSPPGSIGIMRAHNAGIDFMRARDADWLIVISASVRFGANGGLDFIELLEQHPELHVINGAGKAIIDGVEQTLAMGWHLTAFRRDIFDAIGRWDENFTPYGFDDVDMTLRMKKHFKQDFKMDTFVVDMEHTTRSHSIELAGVQAPSAPRIAYFVEKWGRHPGAWQWDGWEHPFNNPEHDLKYWPPAPNGGHWDA